jgi:DNA-binding NtrC family response regulator
MANILVVDDEVGIRELLSEILRDEGHDVIVAENATEARIAREVKRPDLVLLDIWMPDTDGITLLKEWSANGQLNMPVIMMSGHASIDTAVEATKIGALDFLEKPIGMQKLLAGVKRGLERTARPAATGLSLAAFSRSGPLRDLKRRVDQISASSRLIMLRCGNGNIAELVARTLHTPGKAWLDLAADSNPLSLDVLQAAHGGVLYAEEIGRLTRLQQKNLLFAADRLDKLGMRMIVASSMDHAALIASGWEEPALKRLSDVALGVPSLLEIKDEIPDIAAQLLALLVEAGEAPARRLSTAAQNGLRQHGWPGGYSELRGVVKSLALGAIDEEIAGDEVARLLGHDPSNPLPGLAPEVMDLPLREAREVFERMYFEYHLAVDGSNMTRLAEKTGLERTHLYRKLKDLGIR